MKLLVIDGNSIVNRAYYGMHPLNNQEGFPTHAIYGFLNINNATTIRQFRNIISIC